MADYRGLDGGDADIEEGMAVVPAEIPPLRFEAGYLALGEESLEDGL